jgi:ribosomal protein L7/L12
MPSAFTCPSCNTPLNAPVNNALTVQCPQCGVTLPVPREFRTAVETDGPAPAVNLPPDKVQEIQRLTQANRRISAIQLYRTLTSAGLAEAKAAVDQIAPPAPAGPKWPTPPAFFSFHLIAWLIKLASLPLVAWLKLLTLFSPARSDPRLVELQRYARSGQKIQAIVLYRQLYGVGLREAKDAVDRIAAGLALPPSPTSRK